MRLTRFPAMVATFVVCVLLAGSLPSDAGRPATSVVLSAKLVAPGRAPVRAVLSGPANAAPLAPVSGAAPAPSASAEQAAGDTDGDGCLDMAEKGTDETLGGQRDYLNFWDFFDVPAGANQERDRVVAGEDIFGVIGRFAAADSGPGDFDRTSDPLSTPNAATPGAYRANYHPAYDRGLPVGPNSWNLGPPDGGIGALDIFAIMRQFGHSCLPFAGPHEVLVGAGDIAACDSAGDESTAGLLDDIAGTVA